jgi:hypothetical protein
MPGGNILLFDLANNLVHEFLLVLLVLLDIDVHMPNNLRDVARVLALVHTADLPPPRSLQVSSLLLPDIACSLEETDTRQARPLLPRMHGVVVDKPDLLRLIS